MFEGERLAEGDVDGVAHNGYGKSIAYHLWEQVGVWSSGGLQPAAGGKAWMVQVLHQCKESPDSQSALQAAQGIRDTLHFPWGC